MRRDFPRACRGVGRACVRLRVARGEASPSAPVPCPRLPPASPRARPASRRVSAIPDAPASSLPPRASGIPALASNLLAPAGNLPSRPIFSDTPSFNRKTPESIKPMPKSSSINPADEGFGAQIQTFKNVIPSYATTLGLSPAVITAQAADADYFSYSLQCQQIMLAGSRQWTAWKDLLRYGGDLPPSGAPVAPVFPTAVPPVAAGIEPRFRALVKQIKAHPSYNTAIGEALGIEGAQQAGPITPPFNPTSAPPSTALGWTWAGIGAASPTSSTSSRPKSTAATAKVSSFWPSTPPRATPTTSPFRPRP